MKKARPKVLVVAHDAGCGEVLGAYVAAHKKTFEFMCYAAGPAAANFKKYGVTTNEIRDSQQKISNIFDAHPSLRYVLTGTGWMTSIEKRVILEAKKRGIHSIVYLESWGDYRERFGFPKPGWQHALPDELWTGDMYAYAYAKKFFKNISCKLVPNEYFRHVKKMVTKTTRPPHPRTVLYLSRRGEMSAIFLQKICEEFLTRAHPPRLCIRRHPAENKAVLARVIARYETLLDIQESTHPDIARDLSHASVVIGVETVAMAVSAVVGKKTICLLAKGERPVVPYKGILHTQSLESAARLI